MGTQFMTQLITQFITRFMTQFMTQFTVVLLFTLTDSEVDLFLLVLDLDLHSGVIVSLVIIRIPEILIAFSWILGKLHLSESRPKNQRILILISNNYTMDKLAKYERN